MLPELFCYFGGMRILVPVLLLCSLSSCYLLRAYRVRKFNLTDHEKLPSTTIRKSDTPFYFFDATASPAYASLKTRLDSQLQGTQTAAFLVIRNDSLLYERYFDGFTAQSLLPSNSIAKSFTGILVGMALHEGKIKSAGEPITNYLPELLKRDPRFVQITIRHLLDMRSGLDFNEGSYDLKDDAVKLGFRPNLEKHLLKAKIAEAPGRFRYQSINTQLLGLILKRATGKTLSAYLEEKIWQPMGAEATATWNVDSRKRKHEITSAGLNAAARDFAKLGRLYLNGGRRAEKQIVPEEWVQTVVNVDSMEKAGGYKNQWWSRQVHTYFPDSLTAVAFKERTAYTGSVHRLEGQYRVGYRTNAFSAHGFMNQIIYVNPKRNLIIVRLGRRWRQGNMRFIQFIYSLGERL